MSVRVEHGDSRDVIRTLADCSVDSVVTDPPYSLVSIQKRFGKPGSKPVKVDNIGASNDIKAAYARASAGFMGQQWDTGETAFDAAFWVEVLRVLKPGGHVLAFGGTRTYHRLVCAIEDAGFEIRDQIGWLFGSGFPKSHNAGDGWGTALKPAWEPVCLARKPLTGTVAENVLAHGTGALNIDGCRVHANDVAEERRRHGGGIAGNGTSYELPDSRGQIPPGRWPANLIHDGSDEVVGAFPDTASGTGAVKRESAAGFQGNALGKESRPAGTPMICHGDAGSAARFFYTAKADADDRFGSRHPTVKPIDLIAYLARLVTPPGGAVLDPFAGSGTLGVACLREGFDAILIEREDAYVADIRARLDFYSGQAAHSASVLQRHGDKSRARGKGTPLFGEDAA